MKKITAFLPLISMLFLHTEQARSQSIGFCWVDQARATGWVEASDVYADDDALEVYVVGEFGGTATFSGNIIKKSIGNQDGFIARYDVDGSLIWVKKLAEGTNEIKPQGVVKTNSGVYVTGWFRGDATFGPESGNPIKKNSKGGRDVFIAKFNFDGELQWVVREGGSGNERAFTIDESLQITGEFSGTTRFGGGDRQSNGGEDIFVAAYNSSGALVDFLSIGGPGRDRGYGIYDEYLVGEFSNTVTFGTGANKRTLTSRGGRDVFIARYDDFGANDLNWVKQAGGSGTDRARDLYLSESDSDVLFVTGDFSEIADFDDATSVTSNGGIDMFIAAYDPDGDLLMASSAGGPLLDQGNRVAAITLFRINGPQNANGFVAGEFRDSITFEKGKRNELTLTAFGDTTEVFIAKYNERGAFLWAKTIGGPGQDVVRGIDVLAFEVDARDEGDLTDIANVFVVGGFDDKALFGAFPPQTLTAQASRDAYVTRIAEFLPPDNLTATPVLPNTPYVKLDWDPPFNPQAPVLSQAASSPTGQACAFDDGRAGKEYRITADYSDASDGDVTSAGTTFNVVPVDITGSARAELIPNTTSVSGNGATGTITFDICLDFGFEGKIILPFAINDAAGNLSDYVNLEIANPNAGNVPASRAEKTARLSSAQLAQFEPYCYGSLWLQGYNIYRDDLFLAFTPAHLTMFTDQLAAPSSDHLWRVTAVYRDGESDHDGEPETSGSPSSDDYFDKITDLAIIENGGNSGTGIWGDINNDDLPDLFVPTSNGVPNMLFVNNGAAGFQRVTAGAPVEDIGESLSASWGDFNNDGNLDLFVANGSQTLVENFLYKNLGGGAFVKVTEGPLVEDKLATRGGAWADYDNDGWLDLLIANLGNNVLYRNLGNDNFERTEIEEFNSSFTISWADYDDDGDQDVLIINEQANVFYRNTGAGGSFPFEKLTAAQVGDWLDDNRFSHGCSWADYDNDGDLDLFISYDKGVNDLLKNLGAPGGYAFVRVSTSEIAADEARSFGSAWADIDNDGDLDLYVTNLGNRDDLSDTANDNFFYFNNGEGELSKGGKLRGNMIFDDEALNGASYADINNDGYVDLFVGNGSGSQQKKVNAAYFNNKQRNTLTNSWIKINCMGVISNKSAIGAKVRVLAQIAGKPVWQMSEVSGQTGGGWGGQNSLDLEFGLGDAAKIDSLIIRWPLGARSIYTDFDQLNTPPPFIEPTATVSATTLDFGLEAETLSFDIMMPDYARIDWSVFNLDAVPWITSIAPANGSTNATVQVAVGRELLEAAEAETVLRFQSQTGQFDISVKIQKAGGGLPDDWAFTENTGNFMLVNLQPEIGPTVNGAPLQAGDFIGVFTPAGLACGVFEWQNDIANMTVWGDDPGTPEPDGILPGEEIFYRVYRPSEAKEWPNVDAAYSEGSGLYVSGQVWVLSKFAATDAVSTTLTLRKGWNTVSTFIEHSDPALDEVFAAINSDLREMRNDLDQTYRPALGIRQFTTWDIKEGYRIYMNQETALTISGQEIVPQNVAIALDAGWSLIGYLRNAAMPPAEALQSIQNQVLLMKDGEGKIFWPEIGVNTLAEMQPDAGYWVYLIQNGVLLYPPNAPAEAIFASKARTTKLRSDAVFALDERDSHSSRTDHGIGSVKERQEFPVLLSEETRLVEPEHFVCVVNRGGSAVVGIEANAGDAAGGRLLKSGDEIAVFTTTGICVGATVWEEGKNAAFVIWEDELPGVGEVDGLEQNGSFQFKVWIKDEDAEFDVISVTYEANAGFATESIYQTNALYLIGMLDIPTAIGEDPFAGIPSAFELFQNHPNPFNPETTIRFALAKSEEVRLAVFDVFGREIKTLISETLAAGYHKTIFQADGLPSGVYFYRIQTPSFTAQRKMALVR